MFLDRSLDRIIARFGQRNAARCDATAQRWCAEERRRSGTWNATRDPIEAGRTRISRWVAVARRDRGGRAAAAAARLGSSKYINFSPHTTLTLVYPPTEPLTCGLT